MFYPTQMKNLRVLVVSQFKISRDNAITYLNQIGILTQNIILADKGSAVDYLISTSSKKIHLVIVDYYLPNFTPRKFLENLNPSMAVIFCFSKNQAEATNLFIYKKGKATSLIKPIRLDNLRLAMYQVTNHVFK